MLHLLRTEWLKLKHYRAFWWILGITFLSYPGINALLYQVYKGITSQKEDVGLLLKMLLGHPYGFPEVFRTVAFASSLFVFIPAILILLQISNEFTYKTHRQNVIDGWSRKQFITAKLGGVMLVSFLVLLFYIGVVLVFGFMNTEVMQPNSWELSYYIGLFGLQVFSQLSIAFLLGLLFRRAFLALGVFLFYMMVFENILVGLMKLQLNDVGRFLPLEASDRLTPAPAFIGQMDQDAYNRSLEMVNEQVVITIVYTILCWVLAYRIFQKRDL